MKTLKLTSLFVLLVSLILGCQSNTNNTNSDVSDSEIDKKVSMLTEYRTTQYFASDTVSFDDMKKILEAGRSAPSGHNKQTWFFSAILNREIIKEIGGKLPERKPHYNIDSVQIRSKAHFAIAPSIIIMSCDESQKFAAGLASEAMLVAAKSLGYGTKILAGVARSLNTPEINEVLQIPEGMEVVAVLVVGRVDTSIDYTADGITGASTRKALDEVSVIIK
jgi:nitroreductase